MRTLLAAAMAAAALAAAPAMADVTYTFKAAPTDWEPFDFSFTAPDFIGAGDAFSFAAFTINHGDDSFQITHGATTVLTGQGNCFLFATAGIALTGGDQQQCGLPGGDYAAGEAAFWFFTGDEFLPSATGLYTDRYVAVFAGVSDGGQPSGQDFAGRINITDAAGGGVPEPGAWALMILGFGMAGGLLRRRTVATA